MNGRIKISTALIMVLIMILSILIPTLRVFAEGNHTYVLRFDVQEGKNYTISDRKNGNNIIAGEIEIDGTIVALKDAQNNSIGEVEILNEGKSATITVTDGPEGELTYSSNNFSLFVSGHTTNGIKFTQNEFILVQDYVAQDNPNPNPGQNTTANIILSGAVIRTREDENSVEFSYDENENGSRLIVEVINPNTFETLVFEPDEFTHPNPQGGDITEWGITVNKGADLRFTMIPAEGKNTERLWINGQEEFTHPSNTIEGGREWNLNNVQDNCNIDFELMENQPAPGPDAQDTKDCGNPNSNSTSTVTISGQRYQDVRMMINDTGFDFKPRQAVGETNQDTSITRIVHYNTEPGDETVTMCFGTLFIQRFTGNIVINGHNYKVSDYIRNYEDREEWLDHYSGQMVGFEINVPKEDNYNIEVTVAEQPGYAQYIGNFLWTGNEEDNQNDDYIGHSKLEIVKMVYERNGQEITVDFTDANSLTEGHIDLGEIEVGPGRYYHEYSDGNFEYGYKTKENNQSVNYDEGSLVVPEGAKVTMKIVPEYGYQVNSFGVNGDDIITGDNISEFTFEVKKGNFHLGAKVEEVGNDVATGENSGIKSGTVEIPDDVLNEGTARLFVDKNEDISKEKGAEFEEAAQDYLKDGYEISNYLDISLAQVFYKGNKDDVWVADELEDTHTKMTLTLEDEEFDPETTKIIHNIKDGEEFEEVEYKYNKEDNSITFETDTFSTFALVTKVASKDNTAEKVSDSPKTGDEIIAYVGLFIVATIGCATVVAIKKSRKK